jgi:hypothetical protein
LVEELMKGEERSKGKFLCGRRSGDEEVPDMHRKQCWLLFRNSGGWVGALWAV